MSRVTAWVLVALSGLPLTGAAQPQLQPQLQPQKREVLAGLVLRADTVIEAEALLSRAKASAGSVAAQDMQGFGPQWSGGAQLFWRPPAPVDTPIRNWPSLTLPLEVPNDGLYSVTLDFTTAPDYGNVVVFLRGAIVAEFLAYGPAVGRREMVLGRHQLKAGSNQLILTVFGKQAASSNFFVGLDRITARPVTAPE